MADFRKKPLGYVCYLCGQQYGSQSLHIHIPQCAVKWCQQHEATTPPAAPHDLPATAEQLPKAPAAINAFNAAMLSSWQNDSLVRCKHCNRTFRPDALVHHSKVCTAQNPFKPLPRSTNSTAANSASSSSSSRPRSAASAGQLQPASGRSALSSSSSSRGGSGGAEGPAQRPRAYICYLCGQQYGSKSLHIHIPQCAVKWCQQHETTTPPPPPQDLPATAEQLPKGAEAIDAFNAAMLSSWQSDSLVRCPNCNRTFRPDALTHHSKVCTAHTPFKPLPGSSKDTSAAAASITKSAGAPCGAAGSSSSVRPGSSTQGGTTAVGVFGGSGVMPKAFICYLCGQQYGSKSLLIHYTQCQDRWGLQQQGRQLPPPPTDIAKYLNGAKALPTTAAAVTAFNDTSFEAYNSSSLMPCNHCGRTFRPDALIHHSKVCTAQNPFKPLPTRTPPAASASKSGVAAAGAGPGNYQTAVSPGAGRPGSSSSSPANGVFGGSGIMPKAFICYLCGQQYGSKSLLIHYVQCQDKWQQQRPLPPPPADIRDFLSGARPLPTTTNQITAFNDTAFEAYNSSSLMPCSNCGRTFRPEALERHAKCCTTDKPMKRK